MKTHSDVKPESSLGRFNLPGLAVESILVIAAGVAAFLLRFEFELPIGERSALYSALVVWWLVKLSVFRGFKLDRRAWRYFSVNDVTQLAYAILIASAISAAIIIPFVRGFPRSVLILDLMLSGLLFSARFLAARFLKESWRRTGTADGRNVLIYGAGRSGVALLSELRLNSSLGLRVKGFVDDDPRLRGMYVQDTKIVGRGSELPEIAGRLGVAEVLIAVPSAGPDQMLSILRQCQRAGVSYRTVPAISDLVEEKGMAAQIREVDVQDLLSRQPAELDHTLIRGKIEGRVVMVTGAAGSIGSELCRQLARYKPSAIVAFEMAETPLFHLAREMQREFPDVRFCAEIGNVQNGPRVSSVIASYGPSTIYHAAAYKHVPMMEASIIEAVSNNVLGTHALATAAREFGVEEFVLISSDKAVHPTSMMGATKRLCERLIMDLHSEHTAFVAVRFGNVLGSNGSVIPVFKEQIAKGGPVTVTHADMRRYFMTIPEASQLVLQAAAMGRGGEIYVLDMGEQVRIVDIARKLIVLSGLTPDVDIKIEITGVRPGEKLYEELNLEEETTVPTNHRKIKIFTGARGAGASMTSSIPRLATLCEERRVPELIELVRDLVPEYQPSEAVLVQATDRDRPIASKRPQKATPAAARAAAMGE